MHALQLRAVLLGAAGHETPVVHLAAAVLDQGDQCCPVRLGQCAQQLHQGGCMLASAVLSRLRVHSQHDEVTFWPPGVARVPN